MKKEIINYLVLVNGTTVAQCINEFVAKLLVDSLFNELKTEKNVNIGFIKKTEEVEEEKSCEN